MKTVIFYIDEDGVARLAKLHHNGRCHLSADLREGNNPTEMDVILSRTTVLNEANQHLLETSEELCAEGIFKKKQVIAKTVIHHYGLFNCYSFKGEPIKDIRLEK